MVMVNVNCIFNDNGAWCKNKKIKRSLLGFGPRLCIEEPYCQNKCKHQCKFPRPTIPKGLSCTLDNPEEQLLSYKKLLDAVVQFKTIYHYSSKLVPEGNVISINNGKICLIHPNKIEEFKKMVEREGLNTCKLDRDSFCKIMENIEKKYTRYTNE